MRSKRRGVGRATPRRTIASLKHIRSVHVGTTFGLRVLPTVGDLCKMLRNGEVEEPPMGFRDTTPL